MPRCPVHVNEALEPKRKGWFCEECGTIAASYAELPPPDAIPAIGSEEPPPQERRSFASFPELPAAVESPLSAAEVTCATLAPRAALLSHRTLQAIAASRFGPDMYVERRGVDETAKLVADRAGRALLVLGDAGTGKTIWAARWVESALAQATAGDVVLFLSGRRSLPSEAPDGDLALVEALQRAAGIRSGAFPSAADLLAKLAESPATGEEPVDLPVHPRVIIVLDGLDVVAHQRAFADAIDRLIAQVGSHPWLSVVLTMRLASYEALANGPQELGAYGGGVFHNARFLASFHDAASQTVVPWLDLRPWREESEARDAYHALQSHWPTQCATLPWDKLPKPTRQALCVPLHLQLFHEACRGAVAVADNLGGAGILDAWLTSRERACPELASLWEVFGRSMLEHRRGEIPCQDLDEWAVAGGTIAQVSADDRCRSVFATSELFDSFSLEDPATSKAPWHFRSDRLAESVLLRELRRRIKPRSVPSPDLLLAWARVAGVHNDGTSFSSLAGALEGLLAQLVADGEAGFAVHLLDLEQDGIRHRLIAASLRAAALTWNDPHTQASPPGLRLMDVVASAGAKAERGRRLLWSASTCVHAMLRLGGQPAADALVGKLVLVVRGLAARSLDAADRRTFGVALCELGRLASTLGNDADARRCCEEAMQLASETVALKESDVVLERVLAVATLHAATLANFGTDPSRARNLGEEALLAARKLVDHQSEREESQASLAQALMQRARTWVLEGNLAEARGCAEEALGVIRTPGAEGVRGEARRSLRSQANTLLATIDRAEGNDSAAKEHVEAALRSMRKLVRAEPQRSDCRAELAAMLERHAAQQLGQREDEPARRALDEAAGLLIALVEAAPSHAAWMHALAIALVELGLVHRLRNEAQAARSCFEEALRQVRPASLRDPDSQRSRQDLVMLLLQLAQLEASEGRRVESRRALREALESVRSKAIHDPARVQASILALLGSLAAQDGDEDGARWHFKEAAQELIARIALQPDRVDLQVELGGVMRQLNELGSDATARPHRPPRYRFAVVVRERGAPEVREYFDRDEISVGRAPGNDLMLPNYSVSRHHAILQYAGGSFAIVDLGSTHGTLVNGDRVVGRAELQAGDRVELGDFTLRLETVMGAAEERTELTHALDAGDIIEVVEKPLEQ